MEMSLIVCRRAVYNGKNRKRNRKVKNKNKKIFAVKCRPGVLIIIKLVFVFDFLKNKTKKKTKKYYTSTVVL